MFFGFSQRHIDAPTVAVLCCVVLGCVVYKFQVNGLSNCFLSLKKSVSMLLYVLWV